MRSALLFLALLLCCSCLAGARELQQACDSQTFSSLRPVSALATPPSAATLPGRLEMVRSSHTAATPRTEHVRVEGHGR
jgi:hypothetical protein